MSEVKNARTVLGPAGAHPSIVYGDEVVQATFLHFGLGRARVVGLAEEGHSLGSLHYGVPSDARARAIDYDADEDHVPSELLEELAAELRRRLGPNFDVLLEGIGTELAHIHVEYDPPGGPPKWASVL